MLKQRVRSAFGRAAETYDGAAQVQRQIVDALASQLRATQPHGWVPRRVLDVGCGTGYAIPGLLALAPAAHLVALDFAPAMLARLGRLGEPGGRPCRVCGDAEALPIAGGRVDLYWSSLALQWCNLPLALAEARRVLAAEGWLALATLSENTFHELRAAFAGTDGHAHTHSFLSPGAIDAALRDAGFADITLVRQSLTAEYPDLRSLLRAVKAVGANEVSGERRRGMLGRRSWHAIETRYRYYGRDGLLPATYDVIYVTARRP